MSAFIEYRSAATAYYPTASDSGSAENVLEGGPEDRMANKLYTLGQFLRGVAPYVSVAMDAKIFPYGTALRIPEIEKKFNQPITFLVVDTGGAFKGQGTGRIDICCDDEHQADTVIGYMMPVTLAVFPGLYGALS